MILRPLALGLLLAAVGVSPASAVSLGQVQMQSGLGQPLLAQIPVYDADAQDLQSLYVQLASEDAFRRLGIDRALYSDLQIRIGTDEAGRPVVVLSSQRPFSEPVFNVLIDANWRDGGRLVKEMTALVDPPYVAKAAVQTINAPTVALTPVVAPPSIATVGSPPAEPAASMPEDAEKPKLLQAPPAEKKPLPPPKPAPAPKAPAKTAPKPAPPPVASAPVNVSIPATADNQRAVSNGESLYTIAVEHNRQLAAPSISLNQMMNAIQRANAEAFIRGDRDRLKRGSILRLPNEQQVRALLPEDSANLLGGQWSRKVQAQPAPVLGAASRLNSQAAPSGTGRTAADGAAAPQINQGRLKIVPTVGAMNNAGSQSGASKSGQGSELRAENAIGQEEIAARQAEITNLRNQLDDAAKLQSESKRLIELQNTQIKQLTQRMQELENGAPSQAVSADKGVMPPVPVANPWYFSPYAVFGALLLVAGLLGVLLKRRN